MLLPLQDIDRLVSGREDTLWNEYVQHWKFDEYWARLNVTDRLDRLKTPVYLYAGWWDYYAGATLDAFETIRRLRPDLDVRVWIDNVGHERMPVEESLRWFESIRKDRPDFDQRRVKLYVQELGEERYFSEWPPRSSAEKLLYLSASGDLGASPPSGVVPPTQFTYDPSNPVPSIGGNANHRGLSIELTSGALLKSGSFDQSKNESRDDVLVFDTQPLKDPVLVVGPVSLELYASTDSLDTDFTAVLIDVNPEGTPMNVSEGIIRGRFRESIWEEPKLLNPGQIYKFEIVLLPTARLFREGHRIRIHLSSSRFPLWDRNTNTGNDPHSDTDIRVATQNIYHDSQHPSALKLRIIDSSEGLHE